MIGCACGSGCPRAAASSWHSRSLARCTCSAQSKMFSKGKRGDMFAQSNHFTAPKGDEGLAQEAVHSAVTWRTKQFMWDLHSRDPVKWYRPNSPVWSSATDRCFAGTRAR